MPHTAMEVLKVEIAVEHESEHSAVKKVLLWLAAPSRTNALLLNAERLLPHTARTGVMAVPAATKQSDDTLVLKLCANTPEISARIIYFGFYRTTLSAFLYVVFVVSVRGNIVYTQPRKEHL